jgi:methylmalonyl-CoA/ethylmalonyl-CoA epimerase
MPAPISGVSLDHVAVAVERWPDAWPRYAVELGGEWASGGLNVGFGPAQLRYANGGRLEILQPWQTGANPFLRRFLDRHGPGPHHMTFKVDDLAAALDAVHEAGFSPIGVDLSDPGWKEAFLHPHEATGIVVQLAQAAGYWEAPPPEGFPTARRASAADLVRVTHAVRDLGAGLFLFEEVLAGRVTRRGRSDDGSWEYVDLAWPHPPVLRLVAPTLAASDDTTLAIWLGTRPGRLHHIAFDAPGAIVPDGAAPARGMPGVTDHHPGTWVVEPDRNLGTRLVVEPTPAVESA